MRIHLYAIEHLTWVSPIMVVPKKNGKLRNCINLKKMNATTYHNNYPLPFSEHVLERVARKEAYSFLDCYSGYNHIFLLEFDFTVVVHPGKKHLMVG